MHTREPSRARRVALALFIFLLFASPASRGLPQLAEPLGPAEAPQARTQEELDDYLEIITDPSPPSTIHRAAEFSSKYPKSELLGIVYQYQMRAHQRANEFEAMLRAGEKALEKHPNNLNTLLALALAIPNALGGRPDALELLKRSEEYARKALGELANLRIPPDLSLARWEQMRGEMEAQAHEALGHVAAKKGDLKGAMAEFEAAAFHNPSPQGSQFFRLGAVYAMLGRKQEAEKALRRAMELGPAEIRAVARDELKKLRLSGGN